MKILFINQVFWPDVVATAQQLTDFAVDLTSNGDEVTVLAGQRGYSEPYPIYKAKETYQGIEVVRVWPFTFGRRFKIARILDFIMVNLSFAWQLLWMGRFDRVVSMTTPPLVGWVAMVFAKLRKSEFVYWMMDINPDEGISLGWIGRDSLRAKVLESALRFVLQGSNRIVVLDRYMKERLISKGVKPSKIMVNPPWSHDEDLDTIPHEENPFKDQYKLNGKFVVMYSGNHSACHPLDTVLESALLLKDDPSVMFVFVGKGERVNDVTRFRKKHQLSNIIQLPYQERKDLKYSLSAADLHVAVMGEPYIGIVHACKIYGILKIGRPFVYVGPLASHIGDIILGGSGGKLGYYVNHGESKKLVQVIQKVRNLSPADKKVIQRKEKVVADKYSKQRLSAKLLEIVTRGTVINI